MNAVTLAEVKAHLRIIDNAEDAYITGLATAAEDHVSSIGVALAAPVPAAVKHAILLLAGHFYNNREATAERGTIVLPLGVSMLIEPYRSHSV